MSDGHHPMCSKLRRAPECGCWSRAGGHYRADLACARVNCSSCGSMGRMKVLNTAPSGWKRIADSLGRAVYICQECRCG
jgi:hypothetical protein